MSRIDVHHHFIPESYILAYNAAGGDPSGWILPPWSPESSIELMKSHQIGTAILSVTAPGPTVLQGNPTAAVELCVNINNYAAALCRQYPGIFGFFATLPPLTDENLDDTIHEAVRSLETLKADGVTLYTSYGGNYLGYPGFQPLWAELDRRGAVVFVHPTHSSDTKLVNPALPQPVIDYPHETTRTAVDLIISGTVRSHPRTKIILSHAGGTLPYLAARAAHLTADAGLTHLDATEFLDQARSFYFDLALSSNPLTLDLILQFAKPGHVLYGSDFPYAPTKTICTNDRMLEEYAGMDDQIRHSVVRGAATQLFPRLSNTEAVGKRS
ncbi:putative amidohydrolase 2 [Rosellinia necatrix]|uniref:6-methylsalicylate decarboxylase n=1 Tax=Rosellinia necatrix TaxID=77044 RepID=A0A1W2TJB0_ROSNE|nr:putative amidohydrolase 2 [Rosellinia necatrix]